jgi:hypothetical protein
MRVSTYQKKLSAVLQHRPRFESERLKATVTLTGTDNVPMIDVTLGDDETGFTSSMDMNQANDFASWVKRVAK